jgi:hypothetical protein
MVNTPKKVAANKANAAKSTGPQTEEGKERVAQNGAIHGLRAKSVVAPWEDKEEFDRFAEEMLACLGPADPLEKLMAERIVAEGWRVRRAVAYEAQILATELKSQRADQDMYPVLYIGRPEPNSGTVVRALLASGMLPKLSSYQQRIEGSLFRSLRSLERLQTSRPPAKPATPNGQ